MLWPQINGLVDGSDVTADLFNATLNQLRQRTDWLKERVNAISGSSQFETLVIPDAPLFAAMTPEETLRVPEVRDFVYLNPATRKFEKALFSSSTNGDTFFLMNMNSYVVGMLMTYDISSYTGTVALSGKVTLRTNDVGWDMSTMVAAGEVFQDGPYYLSGASPGKMTRKISSRAVYLGYFVSDELGFGHTALLSPQYRDPLGHYHHAFPLYTKTSGVKYVRNCSDTVTMDGTSIVFGYPCISQRGEDSPFNSKLPGLYSFSYEGATTLDTRASLNGLDIPQKKACADTIAAMYNGSGGGCLIHNLDTLDTRRISITEIIQPTGPDDYYARFSVTPSGPGDFAALGQPVVFGKNRLFISGRWNGSNTSTYTLILGTKNSRITPPMSFDDCYLYWSTSTGDEIEGKARVVGYDVPVPIGASHSGEATNEYMHATVLQDTNSSWPDNALVGMSIYNESDGSHATIMSNTANSVTVNSLVSGTTNVWHPGDVYKITGMPSKGLTAVLQNVVFATVDNDLASTSKNLLVNYVTELYNGSFAPVQDTDISRYTWKLTVPYDIQGWEPIRYTEIFDKVESYTAENSTWTNLSVVLSTDLVNRPVISASSGQMLVGNLYGVVFLLASATYGIVTGDILSFTVNATSGSQTYTYLFKDFLESYDNPETTIVFGSNADAFEKLVVKLRALPDLRILYDVTDCMAITSKYPIIGLSFMHSSGGPVFDPGEMVLHDAIAPTTLVDPENDNMFVFDAYNTPLISGALMPVSFNTPSTLSNNLMVRFVPFSAAGISFAASDTASCTMPGDLWMVDIASEAPGSYYQYNMHAHPALNSMYPPIPIVASSLVMDGIEQISVDTNLQNYWSIYRAGSDTVYWYSNNNLQIPVSRFWIDRDAAGPPELDRALLFHLVKVDLGNSAAVTSLQPAPGSPIRIYRCGTSEDATTGDLALAFDLRFTAEDNNLEGSSVVKGVDGSKLRLGPVVEAVRCTDGTLGIESSVKDGKGIVTLTADPTKINSTRGDVRGPFDDIVLQNAKLDMLNMFSFIKTVDPSSASTGFLSKFRVPMSLDVVNSYRLYVYMFMFPYDGLSLGKNAQFSFNWSKFANPTLEIGANVAPTLGNEDDVTLTVPLLVYTSPTTQVPLVDKQVVMITNDETLDKSPDTIFVEMPGLGNTEGYITAKSGDMFVLKFIRTTDMLSGTYNGAIGMYDITWALRRNTTG